MSLPAARANLITCVKRITEVLGAIEAVKTYAHFLRQVNDYTRDFYRGTIDDSAFLDKMMAAIDEQLRKAWNEGMRENGLDPSADMRPDWEAWVGDLVNSEYDHLLDYAQAIRDAAAAGDPIDPLLSRAQMWANRYNDVRSEAVITTAQTPQAEEAAGGKVKLKWNLGATEEHCTTCFGLNGVVAYAEDWAVSVYHPQAPPNDALECGGWRCQCELVQTDEDVTEGGIPEV